MANAIPLLEGTDASGGYLVRDTYGQTLQDALLRESAILQLCRVDRVPGKRQRYTVYAGRPTASFVAEGAAKTATGAEFSEIVANVKKMASVVLYTDEMLADAVEDPRILINADVQGALADLVDAHAIGKSNGTNLTTSFDTALRSCSSTNEYVSGGAGLASSVSAALTKVEANGYRPSGIVLASDGRGVMRDARSSNDTTNPVYTPGFEREPDSLYGLPISYSSNLSKFSDTAGANKIIGIVGDFSQAVAVLRSDVVVRTTDQASVDVGGTVQNLWQQGKTAVSWEMRAGFAIHDVNKAFSLIVDAS